MKNKLIVILSFLILIGIVIAANPIPLDTLNVIDNETSNASQTLRSINISGAYISTINMTAMTQNLRWKAFVGYVTGSFTLDDLYGSKIFDWSITTLTGEIFATRNDSAIDWSNLECANETMTEVENSVLNHNNYNDNITKTFNAYTNGSHPEFFVGSVNISFNSCPSLNTYVNDSAQYTHFYEIPLYSAGAMIFSTIIENRYSGFDNSTYDFQMIVPENGAQGFTGSTPYYMYVELT